MVQMSVCSLFREPTRPDCPCSLHHPRAVGWWPRSWLLCSQWHEAARRQLPVSALQTPTGRRVRGRAEGKHPCPVPCQRYWRRKACAVPCLAGSVVTQWSLSFAHAAVGLSPLMPHALGLGSVCKLKMCNLAKRPLLPGH